MSVKRRKTNPYEEALTEYLEANGKNALLARQLGDEVDNQYHGAGIPDPSTLEFEGKFYTTGQGDEFAVLTEAQAYRDAKADIEHSLLLFDPEFLADHTGLPLAPLETIIEQAEMLGCMTAEDTVSNIIKHLIELAVPFDDFCDRVIESCDYGHFLSAYDGKTFHADNGMCVFRIA